jgi:hypothetical protein
VGADPRLNAGINVALGGTSAVWEQSDLLVGLNYAALSFAVVVTLWGAERLARRVETSTQRRPPSSKATKRRPSRR